MAAGGGKNGYVVCDSQVHAPDLPSSVHVGGIEPDALLREMATAGVDRCVIVPLAARGSDVSTNNPGSLEIARAHPDRFAVMGRFDLTRPENERLLGNWKDEPGMLGIRNSFVRDPERALLVDDQLDWFWSAAERADVPVMVLVPNEMLDLVGRVADRRPGLRLAVDHMGLTPYVIYEDFSEPLKPLLELAKRPNVSVKASALPDSVADPFPFRSVHEPLHRVVDAFGPRRVFWGSDLTRLKVPYGECVRLFSEELPFLSEADREWVLGRGVMEWTGWSASLERAGAAPA